MAVKRMAAPIQWLIALLQDPNKILVRKEKLIDDPPKWVIITDASPKGLGAVLARVEVQGNATKLTIVEALQAIVLPETAEALKVPFGEAASQAVLEALAVVRAIQKWGSKIRGDRVVIRSDSTVALAVAQKLSSPHESLNFLAAELAIQLEQLGIPDLVLQHLAGKFNREADWLSRAGDARERPPGLEDVKIHRVAAFSAQYFTLTAPGLRDRRGRLPTKLPDTIFQCL